MPTYRTLGLRGHRPYCGGRCTVLLAVACGAIVTGSLGCGEDRGSLAASASTKRPDKRFHPSGASISKVGWERHLLVGKTHRDLRMAYVTFSSVHLVHAVTRQTRTRIYVTLYGRGPPTSFAEAVVRCAQLRLRQPPEGRAIRDGSLPRGRHDDRADESAARSIDLRTVGCQSVPERR